MTIITRLPIVSRIWWICLLAGLAIGLSLTALARSAPAQADDAASSVTGLRIVDTTDDALILEWNAPAYDLQSITVGQDHFQRIVVAGSTGLAVPGQPELPQFSALVGVPPQGQVTLRVLQDSVETIPGRYQVVPAAGPAPLAGDLQPGTPHRVADHAAYASVELYPAEVARVAETAWLRDQRLARIEIYPFQYRAATGALRLHRQLRIEIKFEGAGARDQLAAAPTSAGPFEQILRDTLLNYETARRWRSNAGRPVSPSRAAAATPRYKIVVDRDGLYRVTYNDLLSAGLAMTSFDPRHLTMTNQGLAVAFDVLGEEDGQFDPGDSLLFYGQRLRGDLLAAKHAEESDDWLILYGWQPEFNAKMVEKYTNDNVYWLEVGATPGLRMTTLDGTPGGAPVAEYYTTTVRAEQSRLWKTTHFNDEDTWFWDEIITAFIGHTITRTYTTTLTAVADAPLSATVRAELTTITVNPPSNPTYRTIFRLNDINQVLEDTVWYGLTRHRLEQPVPVTALSEGQNAFTLTVIAQAQTPNADLFFDWFEIQYARRFRAEENQLTFSDQRAQPRRYAVSHFTTDTVRVLDISNPWRPRQVMSSSITANAGLVTATFQIAASEPVTYFVGGADQIRSPQSIRGYAPPDLSGSNGADYLIITHRDFITSLQTLAAHRAAEGLRVKIVDVDDLYNQFTDGLYHPIAIKNFLKYTYANWQPPAPTYVLLVGDGHWNFKNYNTAQYGTPPNFMPPNLAWVDPYQGEVDSANELVEIVGNDPLPDMLIGRLPVNTAAEADIVVNKIISYEAQAKTLPYRQRLLFVADNVPDPQNAGDFVQLSNNLINAVLPSTHLPDRVYANDYNCLPGIAPCPQVNYAITSTLNQTGALFVNYIGHASLNRWGHESFFVNANAATLNNLDRLPIILSMTCLDGYWLYPSASGSANGLMETMLRAANGGSVASFSPTGLGVSTGHDQLERGLLNAVFRQGVSRLGGAAQAGKVALFNAGHDFDLIKTFTVFGDPALRLPTAALEVAPDSSIKFGAPNATVMHTMYLTNTGLLTYTGPVSLTGHAWPVTAAQPSLALPPGQSMALIVSATIPPGAPLGALDVATLTLNLSAADPQFRVTLVTVNGLYGAAVVAAPLSQQADPGSVVTYTVHMTNVGILIDSFSFGVAGNAWPTQLSAANVIDLPPQVSSAFDVSVTVPQDRVAYSVDVARIVVSSQGSQGFVSAAADVATTINPVYGFDLTPLWLSRAGVSGHTTIFPLTLSNTGNATSTFAATAGGALWPTVISSTLGPVPPWSSITVPVGVVVPLGLGAGAVDTATVTLTMTLGAAGPHTATLITTANPYQVALPLVRKN